MGDYLERTKRIFGETSVEALKTCHVAVFGLGGVGGFAAEALVRSGIGHISVFDADAIHESNLNRQILALRSTIGQKKTDAFKARALDINPDVLVEANPLFFLPENADTVDFKAFDYVIDAIDTVSAKVELVKRSAVNGVPIISAMGTGNKCHPELLEVSDISKTAVCPLARVIRQTLRKEKIQHLKVVYSKEQPIAQPAEGERKPPIGSNAFVPATAGLLLASTVVQDLLKMKQKK